MKIVVVPVLDRNDAAWAADKVVSLYTKAAVIYLVNMQPAYSRHVARFFAAKTLERFHREDGLRVLAPVGEALDRAGLQHWDHVIIGLEVRRLVDFARHHHCNEVALREEPHTLFSRVGLSPFNRRMRTALRSLWQVCPVIA